VERLGGYRAIDEALDAIIEALAKDPFGFPILEIDGFRVRYAKTKSIEDRIPALLVAFVIDQDHNVTLEWIDEVDEGDLPD
jgi:hypothetical protein